MSTWVIISWVFVLVLTGINIYLFVKLKGASEQMMKMAFPGAKDMGQAMAQMQQMMKGAQGGGGMPGRGGARGGFGPPTGGGGGGRDAQLKAAMDMLQNMQKGKKK
jgi:hypothetical protein